MINTLRGLYALEDKTYYISGAPQCVVPDAHLAPAISSSWFDFVFVQFYNTPQCSARAFFDHTYGAYGGPPTDISFDAWVSFLVSNSPNPNVKLYLGLPAAPAIAYDAKMYLDPIDAKSIIEHFQCKYPKAFGGVMVYEATASETNSIGGKSYAKVLKEIEENCECASKPVTSSTLSSTTQTSSSIQTLVSSTSSSTTQAASTIQTPISNSTETRTPRSIFTGTGYSYHPAGTSVSASVIPSVQSSTGKWNSTSSGSFTGYAPSASASIPHQSSYGRWNTSAPSSGPTSSPSASLNHLSSRTGSSGTVSLPRSSQTPPYPYSAGPASNSSLSATGSPIPYSSRTGPIFYSTGPVAYSGPSSGISPTTQEIVTTVM